MLWLHGLAVDMGVHTSADDLGVHISAGVSFAHHLHSPLVEMISSAFLLTHCHSRCVEGHNQNMVSFMIYDSQILYGSLHQIQQYSVHSDTPRNSIRNRA